MELKNVKTELHFLKLQFNSAKLQHTSFVKHLEKDIQVLETEKIHTTQTLIDNYEVVLYQQISKYRDLMQEFIDFLGGMQCDYVSRACASHWPNCFAAAGTKENVTSCCSMKPVSAWT